MEDRDSPVGRKDMDKETGGAQTPRRVRRLKKRDRPSLQKLCYCGIKQEYC